MSELPIICSSWDGDEVDKLDSDKSVTVMTEVLSPLEEEPVETKEEEFEPKEIIHTQAPELTKRPNKRPRLGMRHIQRKKEYLQKQQEEQKSKHGDNTTLWSAINQVEYEPTRYDRFPQITVKYSKDGSVDTTLNRISFRKDNWYYQFQFYREFLGNRAVLNVSSLANSQLSYPFYLRPSIAESGASRSAIAIRTTAWFRTCV